MTTVSIHKKILNGMTDTIIMIMLTMTKGVIKMIIMMNRDTHGTVSQTNSLMALLNKKIIYKP